MKILFSKEAWEDYLYWQKCDRNVLARINELIKEVCRTPYAGKGKPEPLRYELRGFWSRRITQEHRLVYQVENGTLIIVSVRFHYVK